MGKIVVGDIDWMRNDYAHDISIGGILYPTVEHAYQASKFKSREDKVRVADCFDVSDARRLGRTAELDDSFYDRRQTIMEALLRQKFSDETLGDRLAKTGNDDIVMEHKDSFWGIGEDEDGHNVMGEILDTIRTEQQFLRGIDPDEDEDDEDEDDEVPNLRTAILNNPDEDLANACNDLYVGVQAIMTLIDRRDFDPDFISSRAGISRDTAVDAIEKVGKMQSAVTRLEDLLETPANGSADDDDTPF